MHRTASINEYSTRYSTAIEDKAITKSDEWRLQSTNNKQGSSGFITELPSREVFEGNLVEAGAPTEEIEMQLLHYDDLKINEGETVGDLLSFGEEALHNISTAEYYFRIGCGIAREQARKDLPLSNYTELYWKIDLHNLFHFLSLRLHPHAQQEIREFAEAIATIVKDWVPVAYQAFLDYRLNAVTFSAQEMETLKVLLDKGGVSCDNTPFPSSILRIQKEQRAEFLSKYIPSQRERQEFWNKIK